MSTITDLIGSTPVTTAGAATIINNNFDNLNNDKIETSYLDTATDLASNSDSKIATQKAVKAYVDAGGNPNASETSRGVVQEATQAQVDASTATGSTTAKLFLTPAKVTASETQRGLVEEATDAEVTAGTATGSTGAKLFVTPAKLATRLGTVLSPYQTTIVYKNGSTTYDLSTDSGVQNIAHGLGVAPKVVKIKGIVGSSASAIIFAMADTVYNGTTQSSVYLNINTGETKSGNTFRFSLDGGSTYQTGVVTFDATNIIITWTKTSTPTGTVNLMWEAQA